MGFFDNFKEKATDLMQAGAAQSKRLAEIAKLKTANMAEEDTIKKAYVELGKLYYAEKGATLTPLMQPPARRSPPPALPSRPTTSASPS